MIKYVCKNEKGYLNESFNILINVIIQIWFKYMNLMGEPTIVGYTFLEEKIPPKS